MMPLLAYLLPMASAAVTPFTASLHDSMAWLSRPLAVGAVLLAGALAIAVLLTLVHRLLGGGRVQATFLVLWIAGVVSFIALHVPAVRDTIPALHKVAPVAGALLGLIAVRAIGT